MANNTQTFSNNPYSVISGKLKLGFLCSIATTFVLLSFLLVQRTQSSPSFIEASATLPLSLSSSSTFSQQSSASLVGESNENLYPIGIEKGEKNNFFVKALVNNQLERVQMEAILLPSSTETNPKNASLHYYLLKGADSAGKIHLMVVRGRHWAPESFSDPTLTPEPWYSYFAAGGSMSACITEMRQRFSTDPFFLERPASFQLMLEALTLCQRASSSNSSSTTTSPTPVNPSSLMAPPG